MSSQEVSREQKGHPDLTPLASLEFTHRNFDDPALEWRRLFSEILGTFLLVLVGAGGDVVNAVSNGAISRSAVVTAPGLMVLTVILFMGAISGAHLNPAVSIAFAARGDFPWRRVPGYIIAQLVGSTLECLLLWAMFGKVGRLGGTEPGPGISDLQALIMEFVLTPTWLARSWGRPPKRRTWGRSRRSGWVPTSFSPGSGRARLVGRR
jgi:aquaporin Z